MVVVHFPLDELDAFSSRPPLDTLRFGIFASLDCCPLSMQYTSVLVLRLFEPFFRSRSDLILARVEEPSPIFFSVFPLCSGRLLKFLQVTFFHHFDFIQ